MLETKSSTMMTSAQFLVVFTITIHHLPPVQEHMHVDNDWCVDGAASGLHISISTVVGMASSATN
jgi:hypothetical protein